MQSQEASDSPHVSHHPHSHAPHAFSTSQFSSAVINQNNSSSSAHLSPHHSNSSPQSISSYKELPQIPQFSNLNSGGLSSRESLHKKASRYINVFYYFLSFFLSFFFFSFSQYEVTDNIPE